MEPVTTRMMLTVFGRSTIVCGLLVFLAGVLLPGPMGFVDALIDVGLWLLAAGVVLYVVGTRLEPGE